MADKLDLPAIRKKFARDFEWERHNRELAVDDLKFIAGEQWPDDIRRERESQRRPVITINRMPQFVRQVTGDLRINRPSIKVQGADDKADPELAETYTGIIRHIQQQSDATGVYVNAADGSVGCGIGHFRLVTQYSDDDSFEQDIRIRAIPNPLSVIWDADSRELTREDAKHCYVLTRMSLDVFQETWPDASVVGFDEGQASNEDLRDWWDGETIRVVEYWIKKPVKKMLALMQDSSVLDVTDFSKKEREGIGAVAFREVDSHKVCQYIINGAEILEGPNEWAGRYIPIIPVIGEEIHVGDRVVRRGLVRDAKDPQRLHNYWRTTAAEMIALQPKSPFVMTKKQVQGFEAMWGAANVSNLPYLLYSPDGQAPPPQRQPPPQLPAAAVGEAMAAAEDMKAATGIYDAGLGQRSNETSGVAIQARDRQSDVGTFVFVDNVNRAIAYCGRQLIDLIPRIYDTERVVRILGEDGSEDFFPINVQMPDGRIVNDLSVGKYDVVVSAGPSYSTKREESAVQMQELLRTNPQLWAILGDLMVKNLDWPGADEIAARLKKMLPPGLAEDGEGMPQQPQQPDPAQMAAARKDAASATKAEADAAKAQAQTQGIVLDNAMKELEMGAVTGQLDSVVKERAIALLATLARQPVPMMRPPPMAPQTTMQ